MASFQDLLQQRLSEQQSGEREPVEYPSSKLKNKELYFPQAQGFEPATLLVRILPPAVAGEDYGVPAREIFLQTRNNNGKDLKLGAVLSAEPNSEDPLDVALTTWRGQSRVPNNYNREARPSSKFYVNVVNMVVNPQTNTYEEERDPQTGQLVVRMLKLPASACKLINQKLTDPLLMPQALANQPMDVAQYSFISSASAFPIKLTKPLKNSGVMSYGVDVVGTFPLGALPQGWENLLEDLAYQATPSIDYNREYVDYFISVVNGEEGAAQATQQQVTPQSYGAPQPSMTQQPSYGQPNQGYGVQQPVQQPNYGQPAMNQATVQPQATNMGTPVYGQTNMNTTPDINSGFNQAPVQPSYNQPVMNQAPVQQPNYGQPAPITNPMGVQQPFPEMSSAEVNSIPVPPVAEPTPIVTDNSLPQDLVMTPDAPQASTAVTPPTQVSMPNVDDLLKGM